MNEIDLFKEAVKQIQNLEAELYGNHYSERDSYLSDCLIEALAKAEEYDQTTG